MSTKKHIEKKNWIQLLQLKSRGPELPTFLLTSFLNIMELIPNKSDWRNLPPEEGEESNGRKIMTSLKQPFTRLVQFQFEYFSY